MNPEDGGIPEFNPLIDAARSSRADLIAALLTLGHDPNRRDPRGISSLQAAAWCGHTEIIRALLIAGADPNESAEDGKTPFKIVAAMANAGAVRAFLAAGADPNQCPEKGRSPLMNAVHRSFVSREDDPDRRAEVARLLIDAGADVNYAAPDGMTALAKANGEDRLVRLLLEAGAKIPERSSLLVDSMKGRWRPSPSQEDGLLRLIAAGADPNAPGQSGETPLKLAAVHGSARVVAALLNAGARRVGESAGAYSSPELHHAAEGGNPEVVRLLLRDGADLSFRDADDRDALHCATYSGKFGSLRALLEAGADPNAGPDRGPWPLRMSAYLGYDACVAALIEAGADVEARNPGGATAAHLAALMRRQRTLRLLLDAGATVDARDAEGRTPLMWALFRKDPRRIFVTVELLLAAGADPRARDHGGATPLAWLLRPNVVPDHGRLFERIHRFGRLLGLLASAGADLNAADNIGKTPLMLATGYGGPRSPLVAALLRAGAKPGTA